MLANKQYKISSFDTSPTFRGQNTGFALLICTHISTMVATNRITNYKFRVLQSRCLLHAQANVQTKFTFLLMEQQ